MKKQNKKAKILFFIGIWFSAWGISFMLINEEPKLFSTFSIPLIIIGVLLLIATNFVKDGSND